MDNLVKLDPVPLHFMATKDGLFLYISDFLDENLFILKLTDYQFAYLEQLERHQNLEKTRQINVMDFSQTDLHQDLIDFFTRQDLGFRLVRGEIFPIAVKPKVYGGFLVLQNEQGYELKFKMNFFHLIMFAVFQKVPVFVTKELIKHSFSYQTTLFHTIR